MIVRSLAPNHSVNLYDAFAKSLHAIWHGGGRKPRLGLAVSGGVDSMALAYLCHEFMNHNSSTSAFRSQNDIHEIRTSFTAFIVDHKLREGSDVEAESVATEIARLRIEPHVLKLNWTGRAEPSTLSNFESVARKLRYQILGRACREHGINSLMFAHHADDQAETVMTRLLSNYVGRGLAGMSSVAPIPECAGIYGVDHSGDLGVSNSCASREWFGAEDRCLIEKGGVTISRPLLYLDKEQLVTICKQQGVKWFEDHTNQDHTLTLRNTVRHLNSTNVLPMALRKSRLSMMASKLSEDHQGIEQAADELFKGMHTTLKLETGEAEFRIKNGPGADSQAENQIYAALLRKMLALVAPTSTISLQNLEQAVDFVFDRRQHSRQDVHDPKSKKVQVGGGEIRREPADLLKNGFEGPTTAIRRRNPTRQERVALKTAIWTPSESCEDLPEPQWSEWCLWDGRYWIRIRPPKTNLRFNIEVVVRFLSEHDLNIRRKTMTQLEVDRLNRHLSVAKGALRFTLPVIVVRQRGANIDEEPAEVVVALPSLKWSVKDWRRDAGRTDEEYWLWDVRFKHVDLNLKGPHKVLS